MKILIIILAVTLVIMFLAILLVIHMDKNKQRQDGTSVSGKTNNRIKTRKNKLKQGESETSSDINAADDYEIEDLALDISE